MQLYTISICIYRINTVVLCIYMLHLYIARLSLAVIKIWALQKDAQHQDTFGCGYTWYAGQNAEGIKAD